MKLIFKHTRRGKPPGKAVYPVPAIRSLSAFLKQVTIKEINLANKCMIIATVAYNLKKLLNGISASVRKRVKKDSKWTIETRCTTFLAFNTNENNLISQIRMNINSKWLNIHLLCKLNYSAIQILCATATIAGPSLFEFLSLLIYIKVYQGYR
ncbi:hypothetical protein [Mucilaginibacter gilvus]|uniref:Uncharacterized protein n=1 Tax=Mucilaginibacter gilvus TaxID=2305909 RepID=A0A3S3UT70_9SPHI|nr:hypothetical protein [Mucilaginibacter gilvus]RWY50088.1 hypothetical protein EPL05_15110 [Mucilaginibacter gilvus]